MVSEMADALQTAKVRNVSEPVITVMVVVAAFR